LNDQSTHCAGNGCAGRRRPRGALQLLRVGSIMRARLNNKQAAPASGVEGEKSMADSVYKIIELVGTSTESWEKAAGAAVTQATKTLRDLRIVEVVQLDMQVQNGKVKSYRAKVKVSFKFEGKK
jgi:dodecin